MEPDTAFAGPCLLSIGLALELVPRQNSRLVGTEVIYGERKRRRLFTLCRWPSMPAPLAQPVRYLLVAKCAWRVPGGRFTDWTGRVAAWKANGRRIQRAGCEERARSLGISVHVVCRLTDWRFCCATKMPNASEAREPSAYRDSSNRLLESERSATARGLPLP